MHHLQLPPTRRRARTPRARPHSPQPTHTRHSPPTHLPKPQLPLTAPAARPHSCLSHHSLLHGPTPDVPPLQLLPVPLIVLIASGTRARRGAAVPAPVLRGTAARRLLRLLRCRPRPPAPAAAQGARWLDLYKHVCHTHAGSAAAGTVDEASQDQSPAANT